MADDLRHHGIRSLDEAINYLSLGMVTSHPLHAVEIGGRGVLLSGDYGNHVLLLVDGHPLNEPWNGTAYFERGAGIPFEMVDRIEVTLGPGSVLYGSQAMLGVINVVTKAPRDFPSVQGVLEGELIPSDGIARRAFVGAGSELELLGARGGFTLGLEYFRQDGPVFDFGPQDYGDDAVTGLPKSYGPRGTPGVWGGAARNTYYSEVPVAYGRLKLGDAELLARVGAYRRSTPYLDSIINGAGNFDDEGSYELDRWVNLELRHRMSPSAAVVFRSRVYADVNEYSWLNVSSAPEDCPGAEPQGCRQELVGIGRKLGVELSASLDWLTDGSQVTLIGVDAFARDVASTADVVDLATAQKAPDGQVSGGTDLPLAVYAEHGAAVLPGVQLNVGARLDHDPRSSTRLSPRGALGVDPWSGGRLKAVYAEAFRSPSVYELEYRDPASTLAAPELRPETVRSVEASIEQQLGTQRILFGVFRTWWQDMVVAALLDDETTAAAVASGQLAPGVVEAYRYENVATIDNYGLNATFEGMSFGGRLRYGLNITEAFSRQNPEDGTPSTPMTVGPQLFGNARISYDLPDAFPVVGLAAHYQHERPADRAFDGGFTERPLAPPLLEVKGTVSGDVPVVPGLAYRAGVTYAFATEGPYVIGPTLYAFDATSRAELSPIRRLAVFAGLSYTLGP